MLGPLPTYLLTTYYYEGLGAGRNMFTVDAIAAVATYERALLELNGWCAVARAQ